MNPAIVIPCYNRVHTLTRLCNSLCNASYPSGEISLVFSIDNSGKRDVEDFAKSFEWTHGSKVIIKHEQNIGLRRNILSCGDLTKEYGSVIVLEDDLIVSPQFYNYAVSALGFYENEERIAGISLYSYEYSEVSAARFRPLDNGSDCYFMAFPSSWGQAWTRLQWAGFRQWYDEKHTEGLVSYNIPEAVKNWPESSWKKYFCAYLADAGKYFVYPVGSYTYQSCEKGTHHSNNLKFRNGLRISFREGGFIPFFESKIRYDAFFEIESGSLKSICPQLSDLSFYVDFCRIKKPGFQAEKYVLTGGKHKDALLSFDDELTPLELNVCFGMSGSGLCVVEKGVFDLVSRSDFDDMRLFRNENFIGVKSSLRIILRKIFKRFIEL